MISVRCPHCNVGLKVDETKLPSHIQSFNCPQCRKSIPTSILNITPKQDESETVILPSVFGTSKIGKIRVMENEHTPSQVVQLNDGRNIIGRKSSSSNSPTTINTNDKLMSRAHIIIDVKKDSKNQYKHYLYDNKSKNRTLYNCNYIESGEVIVLKNNDQIQIGQTLLIFEG